MTKKYEIDKAALTALLPDAQRIARSAGQALMAHYEKHKQDSEHLQIENKDDNSPVTQADKDSHDIITQSLKNLTPSIPVISEEDSQHPDIDKNGLFWSVDPLDGTKGFIEQNDMFFVKITLLDQFEPVLGIVYHPAAEKLYFSVRGGDSWEQDANGHETKLQTRDAPKGQSLTTVFNSLHYKQDAYDVAWTKLAARGLDIQDSGKAKGLCTTAFNVAVAKGEADAFLCCGQNATLEKGNGFSWDYAPDWLILKNAGGIIVEVNSGKEPVFTKPTDNMNAMISLGDKELGKSVFPELKRDCV